MATYKIPKSYNRFTTSRKNIDAAKRSSNLLAQEAARVAESMLDQNNPANLRDENVQARRAGAVAEQTVRGVGEQAQLPQSQRTGPMLSPQLTPDAMRLPRPKAPTEMAGTARTREQAAQARSGLTVGGVSLGTKGAVRETPEMRRKKADTVFAEKGSPGIAGAKAWIERMGFEENFTNVVEGLKQGGLLTEDEAIKAAQAYGYYPSEEEAAKLTESRRAQAGRELVHQRGSEIAASQGYDATVRYYQQQGWSPEAAANQARFRVTQAGGEVPSLAPQAQPEVGVIRQAQTATPSRDYDAEYTDLVNRATRASARGDAQESARLTRQAEQVQQDKFEAAGWEEKNRMLRDARRRGRTDLVSKWAKEVAEAAGENIKRGMTPEEAQSYDNREAVRKTLPRGSLSDADTAFYMSIENGNEDYYTVPGTNTKYTMLDEDPDNTQEAVTIDTEYGSFDATRPDSFPPAFVKELEAAGLTAEDFAAAWADKWLDTYGPPGAAGTDRAAYRAVLMYGDSMNMYIDDNEGLIDAAGNPLPSSALADFKALYGNLSAEEISELQTPSMQKMATEASVSPGTRAARGLETGEVAGEVADVEGDTVYKTIEQDLKALEDVPELNADALIRESRQSFNMQQARALRTNMNRMARSGSSPEAIQGTTARMQMESEQQQQQMEALTRLQVEQQNTAAKINAIQTRLQTNAAIWSQLQNQEHAEKMGRHNAMLQQMLAAQQTRMQQIQNQVDPLQVALGIGTSVLGAGLGAFTGGLGTAAVGALVPGLVGGATQAAGSTIGRTVYQGSLPQQSFTLPASRFSGTGIA